MPRFRACLFLVLALSCAACCQDAASPASMGQGDENPPAPLEIACKPFTESFTLHPEYVGEPSCGLPPGREQAYDPKTGVFHIHYKCKNFKRSTFEVTKVAERFTRPIVFRLTGETRGGGCLGRDLTLSVDGKDYPMEDSALFHERTDKSLFRVERTDKAVTVEFTKKGEALLKPGTQVWLWVDTGW